MSQASAMLFDVPPSVAGVQTEPVTFADAAPGGNDETNHFEVLLCGPGGQVAVETLATQFRTTCGALI